MSPLLNILNACSSGDCSIEHADYYRCSKCEKEFLVRSGDETPVPLSDILVLAAYGWCTNDEQAPC